MTEPRTVNDLLHLYARRGHAQYGEGIDMTTHALQCATLALNDGASDELVAAALLHDVGHLVSDVQGVDGYDFEVDDDAHESVGARVLAPLFGPRVSQPVALHVMAKRWRCSVDSDYRDRLSTTSKKTLVAQGGLLTADQRERFEAHPGFNDAVALRGWDDDGKQPAVTVPSVNTFRPLLERLTAAFASTRAAR